MKLIFSKQPRKQPLKNRRLLLKVIRETLRLSGLETLAREQGGKGNVLHVVIVDAETITRMNTDYLGHDTATDVLAFDLHSESPVIPDSPVYGEIYVSIDAALEAAQIYGTSPAYELVLYIVHGILHLVGYGDHEEPERAAMRSAEQSILESLRQTFVLEDILAVAG